MGLVQLPHRLSEPAHPKGRPIPSSAAHAGGPASSDGGHPTAPVGSAAVSAPPQDPFASPAPDGGQDTPPSAAPNPPPAGPETTDSPASSAPQRRSGPSRAAAAMQDQPAVKARQEWAGGQLSRLGRQDACTQTDWSCSSPRARSTQRSGPPGQAQVQVGAQGRGSAGDQGSPDEDVRWHPNPAAMPQPSRSRSEGQRLEEGRGSLEARLRTASLPGVAAGKQPQQSLARLQVGCTGALATSGWDAEDAGALLSLLEQEHRNAVVRRLLCEPAVRYRPVHLQEPMPDLLAAY